MLRAFELKDSKLALLAPDAALDAAIWIDLYRPQPEQAARVAALGVSVPSLEDMEEIEVSARLYREDEAQYLTVNLPGLLPDGTAIVGPITFIVTGPRLITVRHHAPRPFDSFADRAHRSGIGCATADHLFLTLLDEIIGRLADKLEHTGRALDDVTARVYADGEQAKDADLQAQLRKIGQQSEEIGRVRLSLLTLERMIGYVAQGQVAEGQVARRKDDAQRGMLKGLMRDIQALEVHADFLASRVQMATDVTLGMINITQSQTIKIVSVVAVVFLPPTVIASAYGMNFEVMPELALPWGYPMALGLMLASAIGTFLFFKWKKWL